MKNNKEEFRTCSMEAEMVEIGRRMYARGFVAANDGNCSCRLQHDLFLMTPTGVSKGFMTPEMLIKTDKNGAVATGKGTPSSEMPMHMEIYRQRTDVQAIVHAHPPVATAFSAAGISLEEPVFPEAVVNLGPVPVVPYATPGTKEAADQAGNYCRKGNALLLSNHGAVTWGRTLMEAWFRMETLEHTAYMFSLLRRMGLSPGKLNKEEVSKLLKIHGSDHQRRTGE